MQSIIKNLQILLKQEVKSEEKSKLSAVLRMKIPGENMAIRIADSAIWMMKENKKEMLEEACQLIKNETKNEFTLKFLKRKLSWSCVLCDGTWIKEILINSKLAVIDNEFAQFSYELAASNLVNEMPNENDQVMWLDTDLFALSIIYACEREGHNCSQWHEVLAKKVISAIKSRDGQLGQECVRKDSLETWLYKCMGSIATNLDLVSVAAEVPSLDALAIDWKSWCQRINVQHRSEMMIKCAAESLNGPSYANNKSKEWLMKFDGAIQRMDLSQHASEKQNKTVIAL